MWVGGDCCDDGVDGGKEGKEETRTIEARKDALVDNTRVKLDNDGTPDDHAQERSGGASGAGSRHVTLEAQGKAWMRGEEEMRDREVSFASNWNSKRRVCAEAL